MNSHNSHFNLGFIGTGAIAEAMITGLMSSQSQLVSDSTFRISRRSASRSTQLKQRYPSLMVVDSNQEIADDSDWVFLAVLPSQAKETLSEIKFSPTTTIISLVAALNVESIQELTGCQDVVRIVPLPPVELGEGPIPIFPGNQDVEKLLNQIGTSVPLSEELELNACSTASAMMATYFELVSKIATWLTTNGVSGENSARYTTSMLSALAAMTVDKKMKELTQMSDECLTQGGLNEQVLFNKRDAGWFNSIDENLDAILQRTLK